MTESVGYLSETLTEEQLFKLVYEKGKSRDSVQVLKSALANFEYFTIDQFEKTRTQVLQDLMNEYKKNRDTRVPIVLMNQFKNWIAEAHLDIFITVGNGGQRPLRAKRGRAQKSYLGYVKKWLRLCGGIKIDIDDYKDFVSIPNSKMEEEDEADPVNNDELKEVLLYTRDRVRRAKLLTMKCTAFRHLETLRVKKKYINFNKNPPEIRLPKHVVKGKTQSRTACLDIEATPVVRQICDEIEDEDFVFRPNDSNEIHFRNGEITWWHDLMNTPHFKKLGMDKKGDNGHLIKRIHSIRSFAMKCVSRGTGDQTIGDGYGGHKKFVGKYLDKTEEERREIFLKSQRYMLIFTKTVIVDNEEIKEKHDREISEMKKEFDKKFEELKDMIQIANVNPKIKVGFKEKDIEN